MNQSTPLLKHIWHSLPGTWHLNRTLHSINAAEPSGNCIGKATFTARPPSVFIDDDGKLQNASQEMLYAESGEFEMKLPSSVVSGATVPKFTFSRKYIWRLRDESGSEAEVSIWFTKPGTEAVDYLFHKFHVQGTDGDGGNISKGVTVECTGGHLCVDDFYSSTYTFELGTPGATEGVNIGSWVMHHEVQGPKKDQVIETRFQRSP